MRLIIVVLLALCSGCAGSRTITSLEGYLPANEIRLEHATVDSMLKHYFTARAYRLIKDIPLVDGPAFSGYAAGTTFFSNVLSLISFNGVGRKVIIPMDLVRDVWGVESIIHEYIHHLEDMDVDGDEETIDHKLFSDGFDLLVRDFTFAWVAINTSIKTAGHWSFLRPSALSEHIAYTGAQLAIAGKAPPYMKAIYTRILRIGQRR